MINLSFCGRELYYFLQNPETITFIETLGAGAIKITPSPAAPPSLKLLLDKRAILLFDRTARVMVVPELAHYFLISKKGYYSERDDGYDA